MCQITAYPHSAELLSQLLTKVCYSRKFRSFEITGTVHGCCLKPVKGIPGYRLKPFDSSLCWLDHGRILIMTYYNPYTPGLYNLPYTANNHGCGPCSNEGIFQKWVHLITSSRGNLSHLLAVPRQRKKKNRLLAAGLRITRSHLSKSPTWRIMPFSTSKWLITMVSRLNGL